jgi:hypothetical protein
MMAHGLASAPARDQHARGYRLHRDRRCAPAESLPPMNTAPAPRMRVSTSKDGTTIYEFQTDACAFTVTVQRRLPP